LRSAAEETARDCLVDAAFEDTDMPAREAVAAVEGDAMMMFLIFNEWW